MSDAGLGAAGRRARPSLRGRDGERLSRAERPGDPIPVEGEPQADPNRAPTRARVPQGKPPGRGGTAVRCRCQVARLGVGFGPPATPRVAPGIPANSISTHQKPSFGRIPRRVPLLAWKMTGPGALRVVADDLAAPRRTRITSVRRRCSWMLRSYGSSPSRYRTSTFAILPVRPSNARPLT